MLFDKCISHLDNSGIRFNRISDFSKSDPRYPPGGGGSSRLKYQESGILDMFCKKNRLFDTTIKPKKSF